MKKHVFLITNNDAVLIHTLPRLINAVMSRPVDSVELSTSRASTSIGVPLPEIRNMIFLQSDFPTAEIDSSHLGIKTATRGK